MEKLAVFPDGHGLIGDIITVASKYNLLAGHPISRQRISFDS